MRTLVTDAVERREAAELLRAALCRLPLRERAVLEMRYGIGLPPRAKLPGHGHRDEFYATLDEVGQRLGLSRERVRQIEAMAMRKLKAREAALRPLLDVFEPHEAEPVDAERDGLAELRASIQGRFSRELCLRWQQKERSWRYCQAHKTDWVPRHRSATTNEYGPNRRRRKR